MDKITFLGAGSTVFAKNVLGDCITTDAMREFEYALYDIDHQRLEESYMMLSNINRNSNDGKAKVVKYADRLDALRGAKYVITPAVAAIRLRGGSSRPSIWSTMRT